MTTLHFSTGMILAGAMLIWTLCSALADPPRPTAEQDLSVRRYPAKITARSTSADRYLSGALAHLMDRKSSMRLRPATPGQISPEVSLRAFSAAVLGLDNFVPNTHLMAALCKANAHVCSGPPDKMASWARLQPPPSNAVDADVCAQEPENRPLYIVCVPDVQLLVSRTSARLRVEAWPDLERKLKNLGGCETLDAACAYFIAIENPGRADLQLAARAGDGPLLQELKRSRGYLRLPAIQKTCLLGLDASPRESLSTAANAVAAVLRAYGVQSSARPNASDEEILAQATFLRASENTLGTDPPIKSSRQPATEPGAATASILPSDQLLVSTSWRQRMGFAASLPEPSWPPARLGIIDTVPDFGQSAFARASDQRSNFCTALSPPDIGVVRSRERSVFVFESLCPTIRVPSCPTEPVPADHACFPRQDDGLRVTLHATAVAATLAAQSPASPVPGIVPTAHLMIFSRDDGLRSNPLRAISRIPPDRSADAFRNGIKRPTVVNVSQGYDREEEPPPPDPAAPPAIHTEYQNELQRWQERDRENRKFIRDFVESVLFGSPRRSSSSNVETTVFVMAAGNDGVYVSSPANRGDHNSSGDAWGMGDLSNFIPEVLSVVAVGPRGEAPLGCADLMSPEADLQNGLLPLALTQAVGVVPKECRDAAAPLYLVRHGPAFDVTAIGLSLAPHLTANDRVAVFTHSSAAAPYVAGIAALIDAATSEQADPRRRSDRPRTPWYTPTPADIANRIRASASLVNDPTNRSSLFGLVYAERALNFNSDIFEVVDASVLPSALSDAPQNFTLAQTLCQAGAGGTGRLLLIPPSDTVDGTSIGKANPSPAAARVPLARIRRLERLEDSYRVVISRPGEDPKSVLLDVFSVEHAQIQDKQGTVECVNKDFTPIAVFPLRLSVRGQASQKTHRISIRLAAIQNYVRCSFHQRCE